MSDGDAWDREMVGLLKAGISRYAADAYDFASRAAKLADYPAVSAAWRDYAELGWLAIPLPADEGGFASDPSIVGALMHFAGAHLALEPLFASLVLCGRALALADDARGGEWLGRIASGEAIFALAHAEAVGPGLVESISCRLSAGKITGSKVMVLGGDVASHLIVSARDDDADGVTLLVVAADAPGVTRTAYRLLDGRGAASFEFAEAAGEPLGSAGGGAPLLDRVFEEARLALCHEILGVMESLNGQTLDYLKTRQQFGKPIGKNQALQHRMVELFVLETEVRAMIAAAIRLWNGPADERRRSICASLTYAIGAGRRVAQEAVQMHGGMGITHELAVSHGFRRMMVLERLLGSREDNLAAFEQADRLCLASGDREHG